MESLAKNLNIFSSHLRPATIIVIAVFCCELLDMYIIALLPPFSKWVEVFFDAASLTILLSPAIYFFLYRPMVLHINERKKAEEALRESETRFRTVFQTSPDSISISRLEDGKIVDINAGFTALTGYAPEEAIGISVHKINLWNEHKNRNEMVAKLRKDGQVANFEAKFNQKDGNVLTGLISAKVIEIDNEPHMLAVIRDVSEWKKAERKIRASHQFLKIANRHNRMNPLLKEFINNIKNLTDCSALGMRILDGDGKIPYQAFEGFSPQFYESENPHTVDSVQCMCLDVILNPTKRNHRFLTEGGSFRAVSTSRFITTLSAEEKNRICDVCNKYGYESVALIPIRSGDKTLGLIHVADPREELFTNETVEVLEGASMQMATAIERVRAEEALQTSHRELEKQVADRTAKLRSANELLNLEIEERIGNEKKLRDQQDKLRALSSELLLTEERERRRIANDLHDRIGQTLAVTKIKLGELGEALPADTAADALTDIRELIEQTIQDTRSLTFELSPPVLYELGLEAALAWLVSQIQKKHGLRIGLKDDGQPKPLDNGCRVIAFRAARELLFNIVKHAQAKSASISIRRDDDAVRIDIEDDGIGFNASEFESFEAGSMGYGLFSVRERLHPLGGRMKIHSEPGCGARVTIVLPLACNIEVTGE